MEFEKEQEEEKVVKGIDAKTVVLAHRFGPFESNAGSAHNVEEALNTMAGVIKQRIVSTHQYHTPASSVSGAALAPVEEYVKASMF